MSNVPKITNYLFLLALLFGWSCSLTQPLSRTERRTLQQLVVDSPVFSRSFTGFALFDPAAGNWLYTYQADRYFTPASNTKIFTLYTALRVLGDRVPVLHYGLAGDTLLFWGAANPMLLHPDFELPWYVLAPPERFDGPVFFSTHNFRDERYGAGWAWDDYPYAFQPEKSPLPLYGNVVRFYPPDSLRRVVAPATFIPAVTFAAEAQARPVWREEAANRFVVAPQQIEEMAEAPFRPTPRRLTRLLSDTLHRPVAHWEGPLPPGLDSVTLYLPTPDTLYRRLMQDSDNFVAEQLLLMASDVQLGYQCTDSIIAYATDSLLSFLPDPPQWYDGSGLSRYNLFTPRSIVGLLHRLYLEYPTERLFDLFPAGGRSGTIEAWYGGKEQPYVFAKTGTLRNKHCLSGYLRTRSGKVLIFSFMHNNYTTSSRPLKEEMERVLGYVYGNY